MAAITVANRTVNVEQWHTDKPNKLVVLHGFTGSAKGWESFARLLPDVHVIAIDLVGHGQSDAPAEPAQYEMAVQLQLIDEVVKALTISSFSLLGYSMGGRIAISYAVNYPHKVKKLLLESASPGLKDEQSRVQRIASDNELADFIEQQGVERFVERWENIPIFATQKQLPMETQQQIRQERLQQRPHGLANSLRGIGTGKMPSVWEKLSQLTMPVHLLVGEQDAKFVEIAENIQYYVQHARITQFQRCGHTIHVEILPQFATIVKESIS